MFSKLFKKSKSESKKWHRMLNENFIDIRQPLNLSNIKELLELDNLERIQIRHPIDGFEETCKVLNYHFFSEKPEVAFRVYGNSEDFKDLSFLQFLPNLKRFGIDEYHLQSLDPLSYLSNLEELSIGEIKSAKISYLPIKKLKHLKKLYINGTKRDMDSISEISQLEILHLRSVNLDSLEVLLPLLKLKELHIILGGIRNFTLLPKIGRIDTLELCWITELLEDNLKPITNMPHLKKLTLDRLPHVKSIKWLKNAKKLNDLSLVELKGLESLKGVEEIDGLEKITLGTVRDKNVNPILECKSLKELNIPYGWGKANIMKIHNKFPHLRLDKYIEDVEQRLKELKQVGTK
jgi:Leucine-rich repeat (LRR) protein